MFERELGGPGEVIEPETTKPWDLLDRDQLTAEELEIVRRSKRESSDPATYSDIVKITARQVKHIKDLLDDRSSRKEQADAILELIRHPPNEAVLKLQRDVKKIEDRLDKVDASLDKIGGRTKTWNRIVWLVGIAIAGGLFDAATRIWDRSAHETEIQFRLQAAEKTLERHERDIDRDERKFLMPTWPQPKDIK